MEESKIFMNIIHSATPAEDLLKLDELGILDILLPELTALKGVDRINGSGHKDNFIHTLNVIRNTKKATDNPWLICVAILHDIGKAKTKRYDKSLGWTFHLHEEVGARMIDSIFERLKLPKDNIEYVRSLVHYHGHVKEICTKITSDSAIRRFTLDIGEKMDDILLFCKCDITTKDDAKRERIVASIVRLKERTIQIEESDRIRTFEPPVSGQDIMEYFNLKPCREVGLIKVKLKDEILNGTIPNDRDIVFKRMIELGNEIIKEL